MAARQTARAATAWTLPGCFRRAEPDCLAMAPGTIPAVVLAMLLSRFLGCWATASDSETVTVAAGCFWSVELFFQRMPGVVRTEVGYTGGHVNTGSVRYERVLTSSTGHAESVRIEFDPRSVQAVDLYRYFFEIHDPTTPNRQGGDRGTQYRSAIFYHSTQQRTAAHRAMQEAQARWKRPIVTEIAPAGEWWKAEDYHQRYLEKSGQDSKKGSLEPVRCYGNRGPVKHPKNMLSDASRSLLSATTDPPTDDTEQHASEL